jgi:tRNA (guanine37-N1)-methyltransferase
MKRAIDKGLVEVHFHNLRTTQPTRKKSVDDYQYGGWCGMVWQCKTDACITWKAREPTTRDHLYVASMEKR